MPPPVSASMVTFGRDALIGRLAVWRSDRRGEQTGDVPAGGSALTAMERYTQCGGFAVAERYPIADIALSAYIDAAPEGGFEAYLASRGWLDRIAAHPGHIPIAA